MRIGLRNSQNKPLDRAAPLKHTAAVMNATTNETRSVKVSWAGGYMQPRVEKMIPAGRFLSDYARRGETLERAVERTNSENWTCSAHERFEVIG